MRSNWHPLGIAGAAKHYTAMQMYKVLKPLTNEQARTQATCSETLLRMHLNQNAPLCLPFTYLYIYFYSVTRLARLCNVHNPLQAAEIFVRNTYFT